MSFWSRCGHFLGSRSGQGFVLFLCLSQVVAAGAGFGLYASNLSWFKEYKGEEKIATLQLVDAFVKAYAAMLAQLPATAPVPATLRADAIAAFNKANGADKELSLIMVGMPDSEIGAQPTDDAMAAIVESFTRETAPQPVSEFLTVGGQRIFRTVYPTVVTRQSCIDCHNQLQAGKPSWHLNDVVGAFAIDVPMGPFLRINLLESAGLGAAAFTIVAALGLVFAIFQYRKTAEHDRAAAMLADSEARFRDFAESTSDWFWEQDENLRFVRFLRGGDFTHLADTKDLHKTRRETATLGVSTEQWVAHDADLAARRPFHNFRFQRALPDGRIIHVSVSGKPIFDATGKFRGYRGAGRDVTAEVAVEVELARRVEERTAELKAAQSELVRKERLSALGQLTATMAHELRNPLSAIRNTLFAVKETVGASRPDLERPMGRIERSVARCDRIINNLLDFTRMKELHPTVLAADPWIEEALNDQRLPADITLSRNLNARCLISVDPDSMRRVLINLLENAVQAMPESGGERRITVSSSVGDGQFELAVQDTGVGIPADILPKVFEPLFTTKSFGTGLGLPTVKQIVEQHGGSIAIASEPGKGTRVTVRLAASEKKQREIAA